MPKYWVIWCIDFIVWISYALTIKHGQKMGFFLQFEIHKSLNGRNSEGFDRCWSQMLFVFSIDYCKLNSLHLFDGWGIAKENLKNKTPTIFGLKKKEHWFFFFEYIHVRSRLNLSSVYRFLLLLTISLIGFVIFMLEIMLAILFCSI